MAYNYYPATYQPYIFPQYQQNYQQMQQNYQPQQVQMQQPVQQQPQGQPTYNTSRIWVNGKSEADFFPIAPNTAVDLWDRDGKTLYQKRADATGKPSLIICDVTERTETPSDSSEAKDDKTLNYATKEELGAVVGAMKGFDGAIGSLRSEIENMKGDLYGLAGKKKSAPAKKEEVEQ